ERDGAEDAIERADAVGDDDEPPPGLRVVVADLALVANAEALEPRGVERVGELCREERVVEHGWHRPLRLAEPAPAVDGQRRESQLLRSLMSTRRSFFQPSSSVPVASSSPRDVSKSLSFATPRPARKLCAARARFAPSVML